MLEAITTSDGSRTLRDSTRDATYHSIHGAVTESRHIFITAGLEPLLSRPHLRILEVGFGTGLNTLLTALHVQGLDIRVEYHAVDPEPPNWEIVASLDYPAFLHKPRAKDFLYAFHHADSGSWLTLGNIDFQLHRSEILHAPIPEAINLVYFDAFSPSIQPEIWDLPVLRLLAANMRPGSRLVTFCARGQFKRDLKACGFRVESLDGPPGKREMVRAIRVSGA